MSPNNVLICVLGLEFVITQDWMFLLNTENINRVGSHF